MNGFFGPIKCLFSLNKTSAPVLEAIRRRFGRGAHLEALSSEWTPPSQRPQRHLQAKNSFETDENIAK